jgi:hypothetical protein
MHTHATMQATMRIEPTIDSALEQFTPPCRIDYFRGRRVCF